ncbi:YbhB/YbcL family Raf kinase inhibitor-like protein [Natronomonas halophila]|uniref:YbhB/YbcL family Raf kinase inhibitor-like protein n=1 Tax=Natronomonas halophila TaxID=2747817 RepID=UPI0015B4DA9B|nr:YbhB/YbcL family Raf kinase inhibitor-like protein [Natronomonas halophila]QLD87150.1 YbhB/YbcL family Raf kinase inhibitor-like protein [Natronomonas halophila]
MTFGLTSPAFDDGAPIPERYGYDERNENPPLEIEDVPEETEALALIVDDPDAIEPAGKIWDHWLVWDISPETRTIPEDWDPALAGATEGENDFGERGYGGPSPPDGEHTYRFELYALDSELGLPESADADALREEMDDHVIEKTVLHGTYTP